jgi:autotransporter-associated beta strand protein
MGTTSILSGAISGVGSLTKAGLGTLVLTGLNAYGGATVVALGTLQAGSTTGFSPNSAFTVNSTLDLHGFNSTIGSLSGTGTVFNNGAAAATLTVGKDNSDSTFSGVLENGNSVLQLTKSGTGVLTLTGANTYTGGTTISAGTLQLGNGGTTGSIAGNVIDNGVLAFNRSDAISFGGVISAARAAWSNREQARFRCPEQTPTPAQRQSMPVALSSMVRLPANRHLSLPAHFLADTVRSAAICQTAES